MDIIKEKAIRAIVNSAIKNFAEGFELRHEGELKDPEGTINMKKNNCFISVLGDEFIFYSAFVRSFDSSFGRVLENIGNEIAKFSYTTNNSIVSYILPEQTQHIGNLLDKYEDHLLQPDIAHYTSHFTLPSLNNSSFQTVHACDNWFFDSKTKTHYLVELKAGGDLDNKKAKSEKLALLKEYYMLKNMISSEEKIVVKFATAYNKFGENRPWHQTNVERFFAKEELLIGCDYWNFVCNDQNGFDIIFDEYKKASKYIKESIDRIRKLYGC